MAVGHRPDDISPVLSFTFTKFRSPFTEVLGGCLSRAFTVSGASAGTDSARLPVALPGGHFGAGRFTLCCGLLFRFPFSGSYLASAHRVIPTHWRSATWPPVSYHDRTLTGEQMTTFQDTLGYALPWARSGRLPKAFRRRMRIIF